jgi:hypothetical protein
MDMNVELYNVQMGEKKFVKLKPQRVGMKQVARVEFKLAERIILLSRIFVLLAG